MNGFLLHLLEWEYEEERLERRRRRRKRRLAREQRNPLRCLSDEEFAKRYRLSKEMFVGLCDDLRPFLTKSVKFTNLSVEQKVLIALSFYATGSYDNPSGYRVPSMSHQTLSDIVAEVTTHMNSLEMMRKYIHFPQNLQERNQTRKRFYQKYKFPGVLGCIDCTHIQIKEPEVHEENFYCMKRFHSINVQLVCDADMQIINVNARFGGATRASFIWNASLVQPHMEKLNESTWFLGDFGYTQRRYLMTPLRNTEENTPERHYTNLHSTTWKVMEETIGLLKQRFQCLAPPNVLNYEPVMAASIINACVMLHNICNKANVTSDPLTDEAQVMVEGIGDAKKQDFKDGVAVRSKLIRHLWDKREISQ